MNLILLGATGSIGTQTLDIVRNHKEINVLSVTCNKNISKLREIIVEFKPNYVSIGKTIDIDRLRDEFPDVIFEQGQDSLIKAATFKSKGKTVVMNALVGSSGLAPTIAAIKAKRDILLANKETLVVGGEIIMPLVEEYNVNLIPVDSEHSAMFQCMIGRKEEVTSIIITASGGSFRDKTRSELKDVTVNDALNHPNWDMGAKITIDSATMMNKGFEIIEAHHLFGVEYENIKPIIHLESIIHSLVEYNDSALIAHMGMPDMRVPINYALFYPNREPYKGDRLDLTKIKTLNFSEVSFDRYPLLRTAMDAGKKGGLTPTVLNASNEEAVYLFLDGKIAFLQITEIVEECLDRFKDLPDLTIDNIVLIDSEVRKYVLNKYK